MDIGWHKVKDIDDEIKHIPESPGIYFVRWARESQPVQIPRMTGIDSKGILYVGKSKNIRGRIRRLFNAIVKNKPLHTFYKTKIFCKISQLINLEEYEITWENLETEEEATGQEWAAIKIYCDKYHEPPPLNLSLSRELFAIFGLAKFGKSKFAYEADEFVKNIIL